MKKLFARILANLRAISVVTGAIGILWIGFEIYDGWRDGRKSDLEFQDKTIMQLTYLVLADSANRARDAFFELKQDNIKKVVDFRAVDFVNKKADNPALTTRQFLKEIGVLTDYLENIKKYKRQSEYARPSTYYLGSDIPIPPRDSEMWEIPPSWLPKPKTDIIHINRK